MRFVSRTTFVAIVCSVIGAHAGLALAVAPFVAFADLARESDCIYIADYSERPSATPKETGQQVYAFTPTAVVVGANCGADKVLVHRTSNESAAQIGEGTYVLFLKRRDKDTFFYTQEPFSMLKVRGGSVSTLSFTELPERMPLETMLTRIHAARSR
jgi:hypothetical protein